MTRNLKAFGLALVAAMALGAIGAQGASATTVDHEFTSGAANTVLTGSNESHTDNVDPKSESRDVFTATGGVTVECDATFEGTVAGATVNTVTVHPKYHNCSSAFGGATVDTDGCNYIFGSDTTQASGHSTSSEHAGVKLECESSHVIKVTAAGCILVFAATHNSVAVNQSLHGVRYTEVTHSSKKSITVKATVRTVHYTALGGSLCGLVGHPAGTYTNGSYDTTATVTGYTDSTVVSGSTTTGRVWSHGAQVDIQVSSTTNTP